MITIGMRQNRVGPSGRPAQAAIARQALLACGILSSLFYFATDLLGGMRYEGYSFTAQAISELGAIGAPSKPFVDPLFLMYNLLALALGVAGSREAGSRNRSAYTRSRRS